jgi:tagaturonate reductase
MIPYALLSGVETVRECLENDVISKHLYSCLAEIIDSLELDRGECEEYAKAVIKRFSNPYIKHLCASISLNSVSKFKVRVLPSILSYEKKHGEAPKTLLFSFAKLIEFYKKGAPNDDETATRKLREGSVEEILSDISLWGEDVSRFADAVKSYIG